MYCLGRRRPRRHRAGVSVLRGLAEPAGMRSRTHFSGALHAGSTTNTSSTSSTIRPWSTRWSTARAAALARRRLQRDRRRGERHRQDRPRHRRHPEAGAVRLHPQLRGLGGGGSILVIVVHRPDGRRAMTLLDVVLFLPLIGFLVLLLVPKSNPSSRMARAGDLAGGFRRLAGAARCRTGSRLRPATPSRPTFRGSTIRRSAITSGWTA